MSLPLFYPDSDTDLSSATINLSGAAAYHAHTVMRLGVGSRLQLADGCGTWVEGTIQQVSGSGKNVELSILVEERGTVESPKPQLHLVQALAKNDRDLQAIETATEFSVDIVSPFQAERSVVRWKGPRGEKAWQKWHNWLVKASQQARRPQLTELTETVDATTIQQWCQEEHVLVIIMDETGHRSIHELVEQLGGAAALGSYERIVVVIGPEGGFSDAERSLWFDSGAVGVRMGEIIMRASSAGPAAIAALNLLLRRW